MTDPGCEAAIAALEDGQAALSAYFARLTDEEMNRAGTIGSGEWSARDLLGHMAFCEELALEQLAAHAAACDDPAWALRLAGAGAPWREQLATYETPYAAWLEHYVAHARRALEPEAASAAYANGVAMTLEQSLACASCA